MNYKKVIEGRFIERPNRFIAIVEINGIMETCHVKNTGRCRELLIKGVTVYLEEHDNPNRKTKYSVIAVQKDKRLINMDSQAPNKVVKEWLEKGNLFPGATLIQAEKKYGNSRFDLYVETAGAEDQYRATESEESNQTRKKIFIEVKGVTLEDGGVARFPDAPTERGLKHIHELIHCMEEGYEAYIIFVIQMKDIIHFEPNDATQPAFRLALKEAEQKGVNILAYDCNVGTNSLEIRDPVNVLI